MELTENNVETIFEQCSVRGMSDVNVDGILHSFVFSKEILEEKSEDIFSMLKFLPEEFLRSSDGGWSFLNACDDKNGNQWTGLHLTMEKLFALGMAIDRVKILLPKEFWPALLGGMPYLVIEDR